MKKQTSPKRESTAKHNKVHPCTFLGMLDRPKLEPAIAGVNHGWCHRSCHQTVRFISAGVSWVGVTEKEEETFCVSKRELHQHWVKAACFLNTFNLAKTITQTAQYWNAILLLCGFYCKCKMQTGGVEKSFQSFVFHRPVNLIFQVRNCPNGVTEVFSWAESPIFELN